MALEKITQYEAVCDGPSDLSLNQGCPDKAKFIDSIGWGDSRYYSPQALAAEMLQDGWYIQTIEHPEGFFVLNNAEVMCPRCKETAGE